MLKIIDNVLNDSLLISIKEKIESPAMPWFFIEDSVHAESHHPNLLNYSFFHMVLDKKGFVPHVYDMTNLMSLILKDLFELEKTYSIHRLRWGMTTSMNKIYKNTPHTDSDMSHKVILFYLKDSDGDTYFYDKEHKIIDSVTPKGNRAVLFDGLILHSSSKPNEFARRIVLTINLVDK